MRTTSAPSCLPVLSPGFDAEVRKANESEVGKRNGGAMLSMQVGGWLACMFRVVGYCRQTSLGAATCCAS